MKSIEEAAKEYEAENGERIYYKHLENRPDANLCMESFKAGVDFAQHWIPVDEELPELGVEVLLKNDKWINEDFNPKGIRIGFRDDLMGWVSAYYCNDQDAYMERISSEDDPCFELSRGEDQIPTHWCPIELK